MPAEPRVLLWAQRLSEVQTGISRYAVELTRALAALAGDGYPPLRYELCAPPEREAANWIPAGLPVNRIGPNRKALHLAWTVVRRPAIERLAGPATLVHALTVGVTVPARAPLVVTMHDTIPFDHPRWYSASERWTARRAYSWYVRRAAKLIAVSEHTRARLIDLFGIERSRITVIHSGVGGRFTAPQDPDRRARALARHGLTQGGYALAVGAVNERKNLVTAIRAIAKLPSITLVLAGPPGRGHARVLAEAERQGVAERVRVTGFVPGKELPLLMSGALLLVHPSLDEGFGFPPLEAMAVGTPSVVAASGSLPEVVGDAAIVVDPRDVDAWAGAIDLVVSDAGRRAQLVAAGRRRAARFTWRATAAATADVHRRLALG